MLVNALDVAAVRLSVVDGKDLEHSAIASNMVCFVTSSFLSEFLKAKPHVKDKVNSPNEDCRAFLCH